MPGPIGPHARVDEIGSAPVARLNQIAPLALAEEWIPGTSPGMTVFAMQAEAGELPQFGMMTALPVVCLSNSW